MLLVSAGLSLAVVLPAILNFFFSDYSIVAMLNQLSVLAMRPAEQLVTTITGSSVADPAFTIFATWLLYSAVLWPVLMLFAA